MGYRLIADSEPTSYVMLTNQDKTRAFALPLNRKYIVLIFKLKKKSKVYLSQNGKLVDLTDVKPGETYTVSLHYYK